MKQDIYNEVQNLEEVCIEACREIWSHPEVGGEETYSSSFLKKKLQEEGFRISVNEHLPNAFVAEYGEGKPVLALLGEYDALPGLSQKVCTVKEAAEENGPGHGCGHNLLGAAPYTAAIALKHSMEKGLISGTIRFYGCPEEELLCGKVKMVYHHMFDGCDAALSWHPMSVNMTHDRAYLANISVHFEFRGKTAHAAFAPHLGRSALDAVELMNVGVNYLREHVIDRTRIHYTTDSGGFAPNIVPDHAGSWFFIRAPHMSDAKEILERIKKIAQGAAMMTETEVSIKVDSGCCELQENNAFADLAYANLIEADGPKYTQEEMAFAKELQDSLPKTTVEREWNSYHLENETLALGVQGRDVWKENEMTPSSDTGDVSHVIPTGLFTVACWPLGVAPHTWQATASAGSSLGEKGAFYAAKICAGMAYDLLTKPELLEEIKTEFLARVPKDYAPMYEPE